MNPRIPIDPKNMQAPANNYYFPAVHMLAMHTPTRDPASQPTAARTTGLEKCFDVSRSPLGDGAFLPPASQALGVSSG